MVLILTLDILCTFLEFQVFRLNRLLKQIFINIYRQKESGFRKSIKIDLNLLFLGLSIQFDKIQLLFMHYAPFKIVDISARLEPSILITHICQLLLASWKLQFEESAGTDDPAKYLCCVCHFLSQLYVAVVTVCVKGGSCISATIFFLNNGMDMEVFKFHDWTRLLTFLQSLWIRNSAKPTKQDGTLSLSRNNNNINDNNPHPNLYHTLAKTLLVNSSTV